jgi:hypothetical protein
MLIDSRILQAVESQARLGQQHDHINVSRDCTAFTGG